MASCMCSIAAWTKQTERAGRFLSLSIKVEGANGTLAGSSPSRMRPFDALHQSGGISHQTMMAVHRELGVRARGEDSTRRAFYSPNRQRAGEQDKWHFSPIRTHTRLESEGVVKIARLRDGAE